MTSPAPTPVDALIARLDAQANHDRKMVGFSTIQGEMCYEAAAALRELQAENARLNAAADMIAEERDAFIKSQNYWMASASDEKQRAERAEAERDDAVSALRVVAEELVNAGFIPGDRTVTLASIRGLISERNRLVSDRDAWKIMSGGKQKIIEERDRQIEQFDKNLRQEHDAYCRADARVTELLAERDALRSLLRDIVAWDHMTGAEDGPYWRSRIDAARAALDKP